MVRAKSHVIRIMWIFFFLAALAGCGYFFITTLINYFQFVAVAQINVIQEYPTSFPAVTICNLNPFNIKVAQMYLNNYFTKNNYTYVTFTNDTNYMQSYAGTNNTNEILDTALDDLKRYIVADKTITVDDRRYMGFDLADDMLISCSFNGKSCSYTNFSYFINYNYGNCYTFNSGNDYSNVKQDLLKTSKVGSEFGLQMELSVGSRF